MQHSIAAQAADFRRINAANHPPPRPTESDDIVRVGGRVHWLVRQRCRAEMTRNAQASKLNTSQSPHPDDDLSPGEYPVTITAMSKGKMSYAVKRTATGLGLFAIESIPARKRLIEYIGPLISNKEVEMRFGKYFFGVNTKWSIDGSARSNTARYINHSCRPNAEAFISRRWVCLALVEEED
jgi:hypothetical protein